MTGFTLNAICRLECFSNMAVMVEIVSQSVEFSCALPVFEFELFVLSAKCTSERICPSDNWDNLLRSGVL